MSVRIRLTRTGRKNLPSYRIAAFDSRTRRDGPPVEVLGWYNPLSKEEGKGFKVQADRVDAWIARGARLTLAVTELLSKQGVTLAAPAKAPAPAKAAKPAKKPAAPAKRTPKADPAAVARRKRKLARRASRKAHVAKKAAAAAAASAKKE